MDNSQNAFKDETFIYAVLIFLLHVQQQEKMNKMLEELSRELRHTNRFFPNDELVNTVQSLSDISSLEVKKGTKIFRCRLIKKEKETEFFKHILEEYVMLIKNYIPDFDENAGIAEMIKASVYFNNHQDEIYRWEKESEEFVKRYSEPSFWGYNEKDSDAPSPGSPKPGRINPDGISYLYAAEDIRTAILEVRPVPTQLVSVAQIELTEDIKVYSFTKPAPSDSDGTDLLSWADYGEISNYFANPNYGGESYYLATQYISEYIKHMKNPDGQVRFDGLSFRSSLNPEGTNFVLFDVSPSRKYRICNSAVHQVNDLLGNSTCVLPLSPPESGK